VASAGARNTPEDNARDTALPTTVSGGRQGKGAAGPTSETTLKFSDLNLQEPLLRAVEDLGFEHPTPIQEQGLPILLEGNDLCGQAQTGTGKTACFLLATMQRLLEDDSDFDESKPRALIIAPTRELAMQIASDGEQLGKYADLSFALAYGGTNWEGQAKAIRAGADIIVGTPGRLIDYYKRKVMDLSQIRAIVIDEADRLFDMGFIADLTFLMRRCPSRTRRQTLLFSATLSYEVQRLARQHMNKPARVEIAPDSIVVDEIDQTIYHVAVHEKFELLLGLLDKEKPTRSMVFVNRKVVGEEITWRLNRNGYNAVYLSGDLPQKKRTRIIEALKEGKIPILVATDVASRGIHVDDVSHVFNYDVPQDPEDYVHRIGRTARAGNTGTAITLACDDYVYCLQAIEKYTERKIPTEFAEEELFVPDRAGRFRRSRKPYVGLEDALGAADAGARSDDGGDGEGQGDKPKKKRRRRRKKKAEASSDAVAQATWTETAVGAETTDGEGATESTEAAPVEAKPEETAAASAEKPARKHAEGEHTPHPKSSRRTRRKRERRRIGDGRGLSAPKAPTPPSAP